jgi:hypothetical protein
MLGDGTSCAEAEERPSFRFLDGGYAENTAVAMTLAAAQRDCEAGVLDCSAPMDLILINDGNHSAATNGFGKAVAKDPLRALFADDARPPGVWVPGMFDTVQVPSQAVFAEQFPDEDAWTPYNAFPSTRKEGKARVPINITSHMFSTVVTTVDNPWMGVTAGQKVRLLAFSLDVPGVFFPGLFDPQQNEVVSPGHMRECDGAIDLDRDLIAGHAPLAKAQARAFVPILKDFLRL